MKIVAILTTATVFLGIVASPGLSRGMYLGAGLGNTFYSSEVQDALDEINQIDENATAWKIFGGFHGPKFIGVEGGYRSFGTVSSSISAQLFESKTSGWDVEALGRLQIAITDVFGKAGVMFWSSATKADS